MKILFYLPVVTPWWFDNIVLPLLRTTAAVAEAHVLVPPLWCNTGITPEQLIASADINGVWWHTINDPNHPTLRTRPADAQGLIDFVRSIDPDYTFCRSADGETPSYFPGKVRYLMESAAPPFPGIDRTFVLQENLLRHGEMPALSAPEREKIDAEFSDVWKRFERRFEHKQPFKMNREEAVTHLGLGSRKKIVALALEYSHEENFFVVNQKFQNTIELLDQIAHRLDDDTVLAVTDHPLNYLYGDSSAINDAIKALGPKACLVPNAEKKLQATNLLLKHCDGLIVQNSKSIYSAAFFGTPILRLATRETASWMKASGDIDDWFDQLKAGKPSAPDKADAQTWFGYQLMHEIIDPLDLSADELIDRVERPFDPDRLASGLKRYEQLERKYAEQQQ